MNVYDFDGTIYDGDSTKDFYIYCIRKSPLLLRYLPIQMWGIFLYIIKKYDKTRFKEKFYVFLRGIDCIDSEVLDFWKHHKYKIKKWYLENQKSKDVIISASPEFLLYPLCHEMGIVYLLASKVDKLSGTYTGLNCYGDEKVRRMKFEMLSDEIDAFYSDSKSDYPMTKLAKISYFVKKDSVVEWDN